MLLHKILPISDPVSFVTDAGSPFAATYSPTVLPDGSIQLTEFSKINIQDKINAAAAACDMSVIVRRLLSGDSSVLNGSLGTFGDFTEMPKTYSELLNLTIRLDSTFNSLPLSVREKFDCDRNKWIASINSPSWLEKMGFSSPDDTKTFDTPVKEVIDIGQKQ